MIETSPGPRVRHRRALPAAAWALSVTLALGLGWWAATQATLPPQPSLPTTEPVTAEVAEGTISVEQAYGIDAEWPAAPVGVNGIAGTLTSLDLAATGTPVESGALLYTVDLAPVVAITGAVPAFRELGPGMEGADVRQLQTFLHGAGHFAYPPDGKYGSATAAAVTRWSRTLGITDSTADTVPLGRVVFIPTLPQFLAPSPELRIGARVGPGEELIVGAGTEPRFSFRVLPESVSRTVEGMPVLIQADGSRWTAEVDSLAAATDSVGGTIALLRPSSGIDSICGTECTAMVTPGGTAVLPGTLVLVAETTGTQVPTASLQTDASGSAYLTLADGSTIVVTVLASSDGRSIVDGIELGQRIVVAGGPGM
ncbi:MAG: peptidoglycan-binding protein [Burkholderiaceae bacterium]|nr:peptidoglycan-binding protein [Microbacteriaceae bacterium]